MAFDHPADGRRLEIKAPVSGEFAATLARFGWLPEAA
jgi:tRNA pseudouridine65 synthase